MAFVHGKELKGTDSELLDGILWQIDKTNAKGWETMQVYTTNTQEMELICEWFSDLGFIVDKIDGCTVLLGWFL